VFLRILNRGVALASVALHFGDRALTAAHYVLAAAQIRFDLDVADRKAVDRKFFRRLQSHRVTGGTGAQRCAEAVIGNELAMAIITTTKIARTSMWAASSISATGSPHFR
jgi:hypothetical protein